MYISNNISIQTFNLPLTINPSELYLFYQMSKTSRDFETENQITEAVMEKWGYMRRQAFANRRKNISVSGFQVYEPLSLPKLKQSREDDEGMRFYYGQHKDYLGMAEKIFNEFNRMVGYKRKKRKRDAFEIKPPEPKKSTIQIIQDQIQTAREEVARTRKGDLKAQFKANSKLNNLFKEFHLKASEEKEKSYSYKDIPLNTYDSGRFRRELHFKPPKMSFGFVKQKKRTESSLEPFQDGLDQTLAQSERVEIKISQEKEVIDLYKNKVDQIKINYLKLNQSQLIPVKQPKVEKQSVETCEMYEMRITEPNEQINPGKIAANLLRKQQIFTKILRNKNLKYVKEKGTNSLVKYNERKEAKHLLGGKMKPRPAKPTPIRPPPQVEDYDLETMAGPPRKIPANPDYALEFRNQRVHASLRLRNKNSV